jgi:peroxiredoxin
MKGELHLPFPLLSDEDEQVIQRYGLMHQQGKGEANIARPAVLLLDREGVIRWAMFTDNVRVRVHPEALLKAGKQLQ